MDEAITIHLYQGIVRCRGTEGSQVGRNVDNLLALIGGQVGSATIVTAGDGGGAAVDKGLAHHTLSHAVWFDERVCNGERVAAGRADETATSGGAVGSGEGSVEDTGVDGVTGSVQHADESAMGTVATDAAIDGD